MIIEINNQAGARVNKKFIQKIAVGFQQKIQKIPATARVSLALVDKKSIKRLNKLYRQKEAVTDVLSFTYQDQNFRIKDSQWGEIIICYPQAVQQAKQQKHTIQREIALLFIHGLLHLAGFDHEKPAEAQKMFSLQDKIFQHVES